MNRAMLIGWLTKEPELRATTSGISVCTFTLAVERRFKQEGQQQADFIPIVVWRAQAENCAKYLHTPLPEGEYMFEINMEDCYNSWDIGKVIFFSKKDAEKTLKERICNGTLL